ncbi:MAG: putative serine/threonine protein kinase [Cyanobacteria bacterium RYN_339]|nr:putative serine/threonine protein kinase [Cyanobacteria bacterium RYN_339]
MDQILANRYHVRSVLGEGGMGTVYRVADKLGDMAEVALKTIKSAGPVTEDQRLRFKEEFRAMARLKHPNTIEVLDFGQLDATSLYITMEMVPGRELADVMGGRQMPLAEVYPLLIQLLQALDFIHSRLYVHRDIKSQNIRVRDDGVVKLMDFGLMGQLGQPSTRKVTGSPGYLAPEVAIGGLIDASSDLYSVGCLAYEMLAGRLPFSGSLIEVVRAHVDKAPPAITDLRSDLPDRLVRVLKRMLEKEQTRRYRSAAEVIEDLAAVAGVAVTLESADQRRSYLVTSELVGRDEELALLEAALTDSLAGKSRAVMIAAPAGTGKSRLVQELVLHAKLNQVLVMHGECLEVGMAPYEALAGSLRPALAHGTEEEREQHVAAGARLYPELFTCDSVVALQTPEELANATLAWVKSLAQRMPLLWLMDDMHWADAQTLEVFNHCIRNLGDARVLCLGTFRNDETPPGSPVWSAIEDGSAEALKLGPLTPASQAALLGAMLQDHAISESFADALYGATGGNAFFLTEALRALMEEGALTRRGGRWSFPGDASALSQLTSVEATVKRRLTRLGKEARRLAGVAAVLGRHQDLAMLQNVAEQDEDELFAALDELIERQFLLKEEQGFVFPHDRVREALYERLDPGVRATLHQRAGEYLEAHPGPDPAHQLHGLAAHFAKGLDLRKSFRYQSEAAIQADGQGADAIALNLRFRAAAALEALNDPAHNLDLVELWWTVGRDSFALAPLQGLESIEKLIAKIEAWQGPKPDSPLFNLASAYSLLASVHGFAGDPRKSLAAAEKALERSKDDDVDGLGRDGRGFVRSLGLMGMGRLDEAIANGKVIAALLAPRVMELAPNLRGMVVGAHSIQNVVCFQGYKPDPDMRDKALYFAKLNGDDTPFTVWMPFGFHATFAGRWREAQAYVEDTVQKCRRVGSPPYPYMLVIRVQLCLQRGDAATALAQADHALALPNVQQIRQAMHFLHVIRAHALIQLQRLDEAAEVIAHLEAEAREFEMALSVMFSLVAKGRLALARNDLATAREVLTEAYRTAEEGPARNPLCQIWAGRQLGRLATVERDWAKGQRYLEEAIAIAAREDIDLPLEQANSLLALGELEKVRGNEVEARAYFTRAGDIYHKLEQPHWLHNVVRAMEGSSELASTISQAPAPAASVEARWNLMRGGIM